LRAVILAAGRGSCMGAVGDARPKCLVELHGKTLLGRQIAALRGGGVDEVGIVRGYCPQLIAVPGTTCFENPRWAETNMVASLTAAAEWLRAGPVIVSYADIFYRSGLVRQLVAAAGDLVIAYDRMWRTLWSLRFTDPLSDAETFRLDASGALTEIGRRTANIEEIEGQYMGLLKFTPAAWRRVEFLRAQLEPAARDQQDMTGLLRLLLNHGVSIQTLATERDWGEIDSVSDLALYERMVASGELLLDS
jgi:L-glutamine-phosphate cytidylyltransferase